jgi:hypothetical protein
MPLFDDVHGGQYGVAPRDRQGAGENDHPITVVSPTMMYYRWVASD